MTGKQKCEMLKQLRKELAEANIYDKLAWFN